MKTFEVTVTLMFTNGRKVTFPLMAEKSYHAGNEAKKLFPDYLTVDVQEVA